MGRDRRHGDRGRPNCVERPKKGEEIRRRLDEVARRRKIEPGARGAALKRPAEIEHGFVARDGAGVEPKLRPGRIVRRELPRRFGTLARAGRLASSGSRSADSIASRAMPAGRNRIGFADRQAMIVD